MNYIFKKLCCVLCIITIYSCLYTHAKLDFEYHSNQQLASHLKKFEFIGRQKLTTKLYSIGTSSSIDHPFPLLVLELTAAPKNQIGIPNVKLLGNMHGNEAGGREILLHFIEFLIDAYGNDIYVTWLLNNTRIHIVPTINPDGYEIAGNSCTGSYGRNVPSKNVDLNKNFPNIFYPSDTLVQVSESKAIMKWMEDTKFMLSAALHEGALVANYPYDISNPDTEKEEFLTPDDDVFKHLARTYANNHPIMHNRGCERVPQFEEGITNGAAWYTIEGSMGDYNYYFHGCMELTLELSCCKYPDKIKLPLLWEENKKSLLMYCMQATRGVTGRILDSETGEPVAAKLKVIGREINFTNQKKTGEFWRLLLPGNYTLQVEAPGYYICHQKFEVEDFDMFPKLTNVTIYVQNVSISTTSRTTSTTPENTSSTTSEPNSTKSENLYTVSSTEQSTLKSNISDRKRKSSIPVLLTRLQSDDDDDDKNCDKCFVVHVAELKNINSIVSASTKLNMSVLMYVIFILMLI